MMAMILIITIITIILFVLMELLFSEFSPSYLNKTWEICFVLNKEKDGKYLFFCSKIFFPDKFINNEIKIFIETLEKLIQTYIDPACIISINDIETYRHPLYAKYRYNSLGVDEYINPKFSGYEIYYEYRYKPKLNDEEFKNKMLSLDKIQLINKCRLSLIDKKNY